MRNNSENNEIGLAKKETMVYSCLSLQPKSLEELLAQTQMEAGDLLPVLLNLQIKGYVVEALKNYYVKSS